MDKVYRVDVVLLPGEMPPGYLLDDIAALGIEGVERVERSDLFFLRGALCDADVAMMAEELLADPIVQRARWGLVGEALAAPEGAFRVEVGQLPGVTDSVAGNLVARAHLLGLEGLKQAASAQSYLLFGRLRAADVHVIARRLLYNDVIQYYELGSLTPHLGNEPAEPEMRAEPVPLAGLDDEALLRLSRERLLSLDLAEMRAVQRYFCDEGRAPNDVELESIAQTWSEHCNHKTFKGIVEYHETLPEGERVERIDSIIRTYLQAATRAIAAPWVRSAFVDNAGILAFTDDFEVSFKVETHNHPSALEPFGGANTGVGGVIRDIIGVSARPIANTDILCFGPLDTPADALLGGVLHPRRIYRGVVAGVEDYGNKMGIPTVNGGIVFEPGYTANPLVYCGCVGIAPTGSHPSGARPGDLVVLLGGRTGRDGLHGATFSSIELTDETGETSGGAVQIGNPITEKMMLDAILVARDRQLYSGITDCGAGGLSSAVSEMGEGTGVRVQLDTVPLKYRGLQPWEIWLSEAQERMVLAVPPANEAALRAVCDAYSVEMTVIGTFSDDGRLDLRYGDREVANVSMQFLHKGTPRRMLRGVWAPANLDEPTGPLTTQGHELARSLLAILAHPNVRSKEDVVRVYDHEVQGGTVIKPFVGRMDDGPSDAAVLKPLEVADSWRGIALGCGFNPAYGVIDPYLMAVAAIDEAVRNVVAVGADPEQIAILDNFCWGNPLLPDRMGALVRACKGCYDGALQYGTPFVSGKDSLNNEYTDGATGQQVAIPPSLLVSALGMVPDVRETCTMDLKEAGNVLYLLGTTRREMGGSYYYRLHDLVGHSAPLAAEAGPATARALHRAMRTGLVQACHDCSEGGLAVSLAEMVLAGGLGAEISLAGVPHEGSEPDDEWLLYAESNGRYVVEVRQEDAAVLEAELAGTPLARIGQVTATPVLAVRGHRQGEALFALSEEDIRRAWRGHLAEGQADRE
ncbi:MAG: phosphoribosylformylglycinamidine synthase subunit PurL [Anaerolineae bacterium]